MSQSLLMFAFAIAGIAAGGIVGCALMLAEIARSIDRLCVDGRAMILEEVRAYAQSHDRVSMADVLKVIKGAA